MVMASVAAMPVALVAPVVVTRLVAWSLAVTAP